MDHARFQRHNRAAGWALGGRSISKSAITIIGINLGKNSSHVAGFDCRGAIAMRQKRSRRLLETLLANMTPCLVGTEVCAGARHLGQKLEALGHQVRLMPAQYAKPYLKGHKNGYRDVESIAEAVQRPCGRVKTAEQLDLQALHRGRSRLVTQRTAVINQIRSPWSEVSCSTADFYNRAAYSCEDVIAKHCMLFAAVTSSATTSARARRELRATRSSQATTHVSSRRAAACERRYCARRRTIFRGCVSVGMVGAYDESTIVLTRSRAGSAADAKWILLQ